MRRRAALAVLGAAAVAAALAAAWVVAGRGGAAVPTTKVRSAPFRVRVTAEGNLGAVRSTPLTAPMKPQIPFTVAWLVEDGALVEEGDVVARFDPSRLEQDRENGFTDQRISGHRIDSAQVSLDASIDKLDRDVEVAGEELEVAREFQSTDNRIYSRMEIIESRIDTELAEKRAEHARESQDIQAHLSEAEIELLAIERRRADLKVQQAEEGLDALDVRAPYAGIVMLERDWRGNPVRVGDSVWPGRPLARIPDLAEMQAEVYVLEADAGGIEVGQGARVWLEASPGVEHAARVKAIDPMAGRRNRQVPVQYFRAVLELERTDPASMKPGARVRSEILVADLENAITVPRQAVCSLDGGPVVYRRSRGGFEAVPVELGPAALGRVVVASGLDDGDVIALRDPTADAGADEQPGDGTSAPNLPGGPQ
ncbi:MAG TPA: efflux RND transporter periplasmic adaptor subunit [Candidatus Sulfomarinibacteraceae bacterium]|nr:efflux RND transporter periplasmic adaptor subunit [Candidatus Sulfomarinibacteraceae bacterium]